MSELPQAIWTIELNCLCPKCKDNVDLLDYEDFWEGKRGLQICEHSTKISKSVGVICPNCDHDFNVELAY